MGVPGLWPCLSPSRSSVPLSELGWKEGFDNPDGSRHFRLGIDASIWLFQINSSEFSLRSYTHRLATLYRLPIRPLFVFDGPERPDVKRGKQVVKDGQEGMDNERAFRGMIEAYGFDSWDAPGEAEAELAYLNSKGLLDAVQTEDVDALVFGAPVVLVSSKSKKGYLVDFDVYDLVDLQLVQEISQSSLIFSALLVGGDYDQKGSKQIGPKKSLTLGRAGYADRLLNAYRSLPLPGFTTTFLPRFRAELAEELRTNYWGLFSTKQPGDATTIASDSFPDLDVLAHLVHPVTSGSPGRSTWPGFRRSASRGLFDGLGLSRMGRYLQKESNRGRKDAVLRQGLARVWEGAVWRAIVEEIDAPGTWEKKCERLGLASGESSSLSSSKRGRLQQFFPAVTKNPSSMASISALPPSPPPPIILFGSSYPFFLRIKRKRTNVRNSGLEEFECSFDPARFVAEISKGLINRRILAAPPVAISSTTQTPRAGSSSSSASLVKRSSRRASFGPVLDPKAFRIERGRRDRSVSVAEQPEVLSGEEGEEGEEDDEEDEGEGDEPTKPSTRAKALFDPSSPLTIWLPALILRLSHPTEVAAFEVIAASKEKHKADLVASKAQRAEAEKAAESQRRSEGGLMYLWLSTKPKAVVEGKGLGKEVDRGTSLNVSHRDPAPPPSRTLADLNRSDLDHHVLRPPTPILVCSAGHDLFTVASSSSSAPFYPLGKSRPLLHPFPSPTNASSSRSTPFSDHSRRPSPPYKLLKLSPPSPDKDDDGFSLDPFWNDPSLWSDAVVSGSAPPSLKAAASVPGIDEYESEWASFDALEPWVDALDPP